LNACFVRHQAVDVQHDACAAVGFSDVDRVEHALLDVHATRGHRDCRGRQIECDARRVVYREGQRRRCGLAQTQCQLHFVAGGGLRLDAFQAIGGLRHGSLPTERGERGQEQNDATDTTT
jgi:hypothetical protein